MKRTIALALLAAFTWTLASCGSESKSEDDFFPLAVGYYWEYTETYDDTTHTPENTRHEVVGVETITNWSGQEVETFVLENSPDLTTTELRTYYLEDTGSQILRHRQKVDNAGTGVDWKQQDYDPGLLKFDRVQTAQGTSFIYECMRHTTGGATDGDYKTYQHEWTITSTQETVVVPAGTFNNCIVAERIVADEPSDPDKKIYYFAPGVGKVKEITEGVKVEELTAYSTE